ncbi:MAG: glycosyl hydrolase family 18 protein [Candidatus Woykebacteria bacterium]
MKPWPLFIRKAPLIIVGLALALLAFLMIVNFYSTLNKTPLNPPSKAKSLKSQSSPPNTLAFIPFWDQEKAFASYKKNADLFTHISLFWYGLRPDGSIRKYLYAKEDKNIVKFAHSKRAKVLVLVANLPDEDDRGDWDYVRVDKVIANPSARQKHITDLVGLASRLGVDGINIDYETLREHQKGNFTLFVKELSEALHKNGKILAVALHAKIREEDPSYSNGSSAQDWKEISKYADQLHVMTYDEHWNTSSPGPIASTLWVKEVLNYAQSLIPPDKLFAGVALYGYDWGAVGKANGLTFQDVQNLTRKYKPKILWDASSRTHYFKYSIGGKGHTVWYENNDSFQEKLSLFNELGISNLAFWRLGGEDSKTWSTFKSR